MQLSQETSRAADYLRNIFESGKTLKLSDPMRLMNGNSYAFVVTGYGKETDFCLSREQLDDLPGTKEYRDAANALARDFEFRFKNCDPNLFVSTSGRVLHISPEWPAMPLLNSTGTGYIAANGSRSKSPSSISEIVFPDRSPNPSLAAASVKPSEPTSAIKAPRRAAISRAGAEEPADPLVL